MGKAIFLDGEGRTTGFWKIELAEVREGVRLERAMGHQLCETQQFGSIYRAHSRITQGFSKVPAWAPSGELSHWGQKDLGMFCG